jgi:hypothetical protein
MSQPPAIQYPARLHRGIPRLDPARPSNLNCHKPSAVAPVLAEQAWVPPAVTEYVMSSSPCRRMTWRRPRLCAGSARRGPPASPER